MAILNDLVLWGLELPTEPVATGPAIIESTSVDAVLTGAAAGVR